jgi:peptidoglycan/LPS O-acetylase OafA/YrhL
MGAETSAQVCAPIGSPWSDSTYDARPWRRRDRPERTLPSLTGLRAVAAAAVFGRHVWSRLAHTALAPVADRVLRQGANGVSFFFVLSGFVLAWSFRPDDRARDWISQPPSSLCWRRRSRWPRCCT